MTDTRSPAAWLRSLAGLLAIAGALVLSGCGGGSGAPNNAFQPFLAQTSVDAYSGLPSALDVSGGLAPYRVTTSNPAVLPVSDTFQSSPLRFTPNNVAENTAVQLNIQDSMGRTFPVLVTVHPAPLLNFLTLIPDRFSDRCPAPFPTSPTRPQLPDVGSTWICAGQTGTVGVRLLNTNTATGPLAGRKVRFEVVQGHFRFITSGPGEPEKLELNYTVPSDQDGNAVARIRADAGSPHEIVIVQATDDITKIFVRGVFVISAGAASAPKIYPDTVTITGPDSATCSSGWVTSFHVFGGIPPYTVVNTFPQALQISPTVVDVAGGGFNVVTTGICVDPATITVVDATGQVTTSTLSNVPGTGPSTVPNPISVQPTPATLTCGRSTTVFAVGGGTTTTPASSFFVNTSRPDILSALPASVAPGAPITLNRLNSGTVDTSQPAASIVNVTLFVSDTRQVKSVTVPVTNTCP